MPVPQYQTADGRPPKRSTIIADLVDVWNSSFFRSRGVEAVLYKGRERRSGRYTGTVDMHLPERRQKEAVPTYTLYLQCVPPVDERAL